MDEYQSLYQYHHSGTYFIDFLKGIKHATRPPSVHNPLAIIEYGYNDCMEISNTHESRSATHTSSNVVIFLNTTKAFVDKCYPAGLEIGSDTLNHRDLRVVTFQPIYITKLRGYIPHQTEP